ncbi:MAG: metallophosphoesterase family protein [Phycisphaerae bacterium]
MPTSPADSARTDDVQHHRRIAVFGGVYNNYLALEAAIADATGRGVDAIYCLGDLGAFGPHPNRVFPLLIENCVRVVQGNYDDSIGRGLSHCQCGYTDPRDNHFAALSYAYTYTHTDKRWRPWLRALPAALRVRLGPFRVLMCHGSPRRTNEFLWESTTSTQFLDRLARDYDADVILATHTGIKWERTLSGRRRFVNVGVIGRPENDGRTDVWYAILNTAGADTANVGSPDAGTPDVDAAGAGPSKLDPPQAGTANADASCNLRVQFIPVPYDYERLASDMAAEHLPDAFVETIRTGWWTTCLEILPAKERLRGRY